jgi:hypothetical protein
LDGFFFPCKISFRSMRYQLILGLALFSLVAALFVLSPSAFPHGNNTANEEPKPAGLALNQAQGETEHDSVTNLVPLMTPKPAALQTGSTTSATAAAFTTLEDWFKVVAVPAPDSVQRSSAAIQRAFDALGRDNPERLAAWTRVVRGTGGALECVVPAACAHFARTLLVVKLNPVRLLWLDALLRFYSAGFPHIAFYAPSRKTPAGGPAGDHSTAKGWALVGQYDTMVRFVPDNYGFCDHETVADAMTLNGPAINGSAAPYFTGYIFLSDDVLLQFWRLPSEAKLDLSRAYHQTFHKGTIERSPNHAAALEELFVALPHLKSVVNAKDPPFGSTVGVYYVPHAMALAFTTASRIHLRHSTYNEWGTPLVLTAADEGKYLPLRGKLIWGPKRHYARRVFNHADHVWQHPVRASSETFARATHFLYTTIVPLSQQQKGQPEYPATLPRLDSGAMFDAPCLRCAAHPIEQRAMKSLFHSCVALDASVCTCGRGVDVPKGTRGGGANATGGTRSLRALSQRQLVEAWPKLPGGNRAAPLIGGCVAAAGAAAVVEEFVCEWELAHEGFWNDGTVRAVYDELIPSLRAMRRSSLAWQPFPRCCVV